MSFPKDFLWGGATAANQYEGGYNLGGRGPSTLDCMTLGSFKKLRMITIEDHGKLKQVSRNEALPEGANGIILPDVYYPNHSATDFYNHYKEDIAYMGELGFKAYRMSISWSRIFPNGNDEIPNEEGLKFYDEVFFELSKYKIKPIVTLNHFEMPLTLANEIEGWASRMTIDYFERFCQLVISRYSKYVEYWITFNEINFMRSWHTLGIRNNCEQNRFQAMHHVFLASAKVVKWVHKHYPNSKIGMMLAYPLTYAEDCDPNNVFKAMQDMNDEYFFADVQVRGKYPNYKLNYFKSKGIKIKKEVDDDNILLEGKVDYISISYYHSGVATVRKDAQTTGGNLIQLVKNKYLKANDWGWQIDPLGLRISLNALYDRYQLPLFIVENGIGAVDYINEDGEIIDDYRIDYLRKHIQCMRDAITIDGVEVIGYTAWGWIDIVSGGTGEIRKRYGVVYVDVDDKGNGTFKRIKKKSFYWYKNVISSNGENL